MPINQRFSGGPEFSGRRTLLSCGLLFLSALLAACGGGGGGGGGGDGSPSACQGATLLSDTAQAGDPVELKTNGQLEQAYLLIDGDEVVLASSPSDMGYLIALPVTPIWAAQGGVAELAADLDGARCDLGSVTVESLPAAADDEVYLSMLNSLEQALANFESAFGYDPDTITDENLQSDPILLTAHYVHEIFNDPTSEISLPYQRDVFATLSDEDKQFIAQLMEKLDLVALLSEFGAQFDGPIFVEQEPAVVARAELIEPSVTRATCSGTYADNSKHKVDIYNGETLSRGMKLSYEAQTKQRNAAANAASTNAKNSAINTLFTVGSQVSKGAYASPLGVLATAMAVTSITDSMEVDMVAALLPSEITKADVTIIPKSRLEEDYTDKFSDPSWLFRIEARSKEYDFSKLVADTGFAALGAPNSPVDPNLMFGTTEVASRVTGKARAQDCELIVPPITWGNINIDGSYADATFLSGSAFELEGETSRKIKPVAIGVSELEVKLKSELFPSYTNTLADERDTVEVENLRKQFSFSSDPVVVQNAGDTVDVVVSILNSVFPEKHELTSSADLAVAKSRSGNVLDLTLSTSPDPKKYPLSLTLKSTSKSLDPQGDRAKTVLVKLEDLKVEIEETLAGSCDEKVYVEENRAEVTGFENDDSVTWSADGGTLTVLPDNGVRFSTEELGTFVLTATSNEDNSISANVTINTLDCAGNVFMNALVVTDAASPVEECTESNPEDIAQETYFGDVDPNYQGLNPSNVRDKFASLSVGRPFTFDQSDSDNLVFSDQRGEDCHSQTFSLIAESRGAVENLGDNTIGFGTRHENQGHCYKQEESEGELVTDCAPSSVAALYIMAWVFEHQSEADYDLNLDLACSAKPIPGLPVSSNMTFSLHTYNEKNEEVNVLPMTDPSIHFADCRDGQTPVGRRWTVPAMAEGSTVMLLGNFSELVVASPGNENGEEPPVGVYTAEGEISGTIQFTVN